MLLEAPKATVNLMLFTSPTCMPCKRAKPVVRGMVDYLRLNPNNMIIHTIIDIMDDSKLGLLDKYAITSVPTLVVTIRKDGSESVQTMIYTGNQIDSADVLDDIVFELDGK